MFITSTVYKDSLIQQVIHGKAEEVDIPEKIDVLVSEWMGFYLLHDPGEGQAPQCRWDRAAVPRQDRLGRLHYGRVQPGERRLLEQCLRVRHVATQASRSRP